MIGLRVLKVSPEVLVEFLKARGGEKRTYTVADALPDDAEVVKQRVNEAGTVELLLRSKEWGDEGTWPIPEVRSPAVTVHFGEEAIAAAAAVAAGEGGSTANQQQG